MIPCFSLLELSAQVDSSARSDDSITKIEQLPLATISRGITIFTNRDNLFRDDIKAVYRGGTLAEVLGASGGFYIRDYGPGSLASVSWRGLGPSQIGTYWNDLPLNNSTYGITDFNLLPIVAFSNANAVSAGTSSTRPSAGIGGAVLLRSVPSKEGGSVNLGIASFGGRQGSFSLTRKIGRLQAMGAIYGNSARNDFPYQNTAILGSPEVKQVDAGVQSYGALASLLIPFKKDYEGDLAIWYHSAKRGLPPTMLTSSTGERQHDDALRATFNIFQKTYSSYQVSPFGHIGASLERLVYQNPVAGFTDTTNTLRLNANAGLRTITRSKHLEIGIRSLQDFASHPSLKDRAKASNLSALWAGVSWIRDLWQARFLVSAESANGNSPTPTGSISMSRNRSSFTLSGELVRNYRYPTLNDLYWFPGGNPDLKAEHGYSSTFSLHKQFTFKKEHKVEVKPTIYAYTLQNKLVWLPGDLGFWEATNQAQARAIGGEGNLKYTFQRRNFKTTLGANFGVVNARVQDISNAKNKWSVPAYVPPYTGSVEASTEVKGFSFWISHSLTGYRYTSGENKDFLPAYGLNSMRVAYKVKLSNDRDVEASFRVRNSLDNTYQTLAWRPMPGRNYSLQLNFTF